MGQGPMNLWPFTKRSRKQIMPTDSQGSLGARLTKYPCFDFELFVDPSDRTASPIVHHGIYEHHIMPVFKQTVKPGMRVLDIGANIGVYAVAAARLGAEVIAIDASTENCKLIAINAQLNGVSVQILPMAVSDTVGMALFGKTNESNKVIRSFDLAPHTFDYLEAAFAAPVDMIVGDQRIDLVKIDIEGREHAALKNANRLFAQRPVFFLEYASDMSVAGSGVPGTELLKLFVDRGYKMMVIGLRGPNVDCGSDIAMVDRIAAEEREAGITITDLLLTP
jgi:FkbM family methyltransferase